MLFDDLVEFAGALDSVNLRDSQIVVDVDGLAYTTTKLPCSKGVEIFTHLQAVLGPVLPAAVTGKFKGLDPRVMQAVAENAMRHGVVSMLRDMLTSTTVDRLRSGGVTSERGGNVKANFDAHFAGEYPHLLKVCLLVLAHNFRGPTLGAL